MNLPYAARLAFRLILMLTAGVGLLWGRTPSPAVASLVGDPLDMTAPSAVESRALDAGGSESVLQRTNWWASVQEDISRSEYRVTWQEQTHLPDIAPAYQAPNRAHNLRTYFAADASSAGQGSAGIRVVPRTGDPLAWEWGLTLVGYGHAADVRPVAPARMSVTDSRVEYDRGSLVEGYDNSARGLEQRLTLSAPPEPVSAPGASEIVLDLTLGGDLIPRLMEEDSEPGEAAIEFLTPGGVRVLRYGRLYAYDATGRPLPTRLHLVPADSGAHADRWARNTEHAIRSTQHAARNTQYTVRITVNTDAAVYPVAIASLITTPAWTAESNQAGALFGDSVGTAGDVNGDGYADVIVGAPQYDNGQDGEGRAFVYHGSASGLGATAAWTAEGNQAFARLGEAVGTAGDVNGDGYADVVVGVPGYAYSPDGRGRVLVYHGSASGLASSPASAVDSPATDGGGFGAALGAAGDVNGDGYADVVVGTPRYEGDHTDEGRADLYLGSAAGLGPVSVWFAVGGHSARLFGFAIGTAGDVNGDGYADVIVGEPGYGWEFGRAHVYHGSAAGLVGTTADWIVEGTDDGGMLGIAVGTAGDVNGDGYADVIVGADDDSEGIGKVFVYHGSAAGLSRDTPDWSAQGLDHGDYFGSSVGTAGDVNGDGYADVVVGAIRYRGIGDPVAGRAYVYLGHATGLTSGPADWTVGDYQANDSLGWSAATAGDVNGDGCADVIVGAPRHDGGETDEGRAYIYLGSASSLSATANWTAESDNVGGQFGYALGPAGDVNGDGYADVVIGALRYDGGQAEEGAAFAFYGSASGLSTTPDWMAESNQAYAQYGHSASTAGDVNGDGYDDVLIGASFYDAGQQDEGRAFVFFGSPAGLSPTPNWTAEADSVEAHYGGWANTAGDVNGDGYADIIVGAQWYTGDEREEGKAYVYHGSPTGPSATPDWTAEGNQVDARYGRSVSTAGDVNGDGYADVIVGAFVYDNGQTDEGKVWVYHGSPSGLSTTADWTAESNQTSSRFGRTVSTAGDVNGDGYADVIIGAYWYKNGQDNEGRVFVYHGSPSGLRRTPAWTAESNQQDAELGRASNTAGDVNGDGYADVIVGAYRYDVSGRDEGKVWLYHGSAAGLSTTPAWTAEGDQADAFFGHSASTAGDVNGDGYADVIVSADWYDAGQENEGRVYLFYGNGGRGMSLRPRQRRSDGSAPIAHLGQASDNALRLALLGRTPFGRGQVKLEWEARPLGVPLDGSGIRQADSWVDTGVAGAALDQLVSGLQANTPYHWRVRLRYHPAGSPFAQYSRWLTVPWNGWQEQDLRTGVAVPGIEFRSAAYSAAENAGSVTVRVDLSSASARQVTVDYATGDGTAAAGQDYVAKSGTLTFSPGTTSRTFSVTLVDDAVDEPDETVLLSLSNPAGATLGANSQSTLTLLDDDDPPRVDFSAAAYSVSESMGSVTIQVQLSAASSRRVTVDYATGDGTASAGSDYQATSGTLTFEPGVTQGAFDIPLLADLLDEADETVVLMLSNPQNATLWNNNPATLTLLDDDDPPVVRFGRAAYTASEAAGAATVSVVLDAASAQIVTVDYATSDGTARAPGDYGSTSGTLTFSPGATSRAFEVPVVDDGLAEGDETVLLRLSNASHATLGGPNPATLILSDSGISVYVPVIVR